MSTISLLIEALRQRQYSKIFKDPQLRPIAVAGLSVGVFVTLAIVQTASLWRSISKSTLNPQLLAALKEIHESKILFNPPKEMDQGKPVRVEARISYQDIGDAISKNLKGPGEVSLERIPVGKKMKVTLFGDEEEFKIKKYSSDEQLVAGRPYAQWEWDVTPLESGEKQLHLKAVINLEGVGEEATSYDVPVIDKPINVKINPAYIAEQAARNKDIWGYIIGSGSALGLIAAIWGGIKAWRKRRKKVLEDEKSASWQTVTNPPSKSKQ